MVPRIRLRAAGQDRREGKDQLHRGKDKMISYRLSNGKQGTITHPLALLIFYTRIYYGEKEKDQSDTLRWRITKAWRRSAKCRQTKENEPRGFCSSYLHSAQRHR